MKKEKNMFKKKILTPLSLLLVIGMLTGCESSVSQDLASNIVNEVKTNVESVVDSDIVAGITDEIESISNTISDDFDYNEPDESSTTIDTTANPDYTPWVVVNNNVPYFTDEEKTSLEPFEIYSDLDELGRCGVAYANICQELMPTEARGEIGSVKPSGWHTYNYGSLVDGNYLYNRCHLIGFQLAGENANPKNLITGTRYLNIQGMLDFENEIADYVKSTNNHVLYRVTPQFEGDNLLCDGLLMEAYSVEDNGEGVQFCVFAYNIQPGIGIDYATGESWILGEETSEVVESTSTISSEDQVDLVLNTNSKKYHKPECSMVAKMSESNKETYNGTIAWLQENGYEPCGYCMK